MWIGLILVLASQVVSISASAGEPLTIISPTTFREGLVVRDAVKEECGILEKVPGYIEEYAQKNGTVTTTPKSPGTNGRVLTVEITEMTEVGGWMGPKSITISGTLRDKGKVVGTINARRTTMGGPFGVFGGVCGMYSRCAKALGKDVSEWLEAPAMGVEKIN
jgi:hypothetical protein